MALFKGIISQAVAAEVNAAVNAGTIAQLAQALVKNSGASIASTTLLASAPGPVAIEFSVLAHTAGASGTVNLSITYTDADTGAVTTYSTGALSLATANVVPLNGLGGGVVNAKPGTAIKYSTTWATAGTYDLLISVEAI